MDVPQWAISITEGTLVEWNVGVGDAIGVDGIVAVVETDKVSVDVRTPTAGTVLELLAEPDDIVEVGAPLIKFSSEIAEGALDAAPSPAPPSDAPSAAIAVEAEPLASAVPAASSTPARCACAPAYSR